MCRKEREDPSVGKVPGRFLLHSPEMCEHFAVANAWSRLMNMDSYSK
jgi:hypothetical protein